MNIGTLTLSKLTHVWLVTISVALIFLIAGKAQSGNNVIDFDQINVHRII